MPRKQPKDYFEHLRTVHFTLVFLCVASFLIALARGKEEISPAREQLDQIWKLVDEWNPNFLQASIPATDKNALLPDGPTNLIANTNEGKWTFAAKLESKQPVAFAALDEAIKEDLRTDCTSDTTTVKGGRGNRDPRRVGSEIPTPQNLNEFEEIWNSLPHAKLVQPDWEGGAYTIYDPDTKGLPSPKCAMKQLELRSLFGSQGFGHDPSRYKCSVSCPVP